MIQLFLQRFVPLLRTLSRRSDNGLPGLDSRRCFVYELLLTREKFYEEADYVWRRTGTGPQSSGHGCVRDSCMSLTWLRGGARASPSNVILELPSLPKLFQN